MGPPVVYTLGRVLVDFYGVELNRPLEDVHTFRKYLGGSAGNTAVALARLGQPTGLISRVGDDVMGLYLRQVLETEGVDTRMVVVDPVHPTGMVFAALSPPADSAVLFFPPEPAYTMLEPGDLDMTLVEAAGALVIAGTALATAAGRAATLLALIHNRNTDGVNVLDVDWRPGFWSDHQEAVREYEKILPGIDIVLANEPELEFLGQHADVQQAANRVLSFGPREVVAKRGGDGAYLVTQDRMVYQPAVPATVVNTLGAGDGFGAAYTYGYLQGWPAERRLLFAAAAGAIVVSRHSCSEAMPTLGDIEERVEAARDARHKG